MLNVDKFVIYKNVTTVLILDTETSDEEGGAHVEAKIILPRYKHYK